MGCRKSREQSKSFMQSFGLNERSSGSGEGVEQFERIKTMSLAVSQDSHGFAMTTVWCRRIAQIANALIEQIVVGIAQAALTMLLWKKTGWSFAILAVCNPQHGSFHFRHVKTVLVVRNAIQHERFGHE